MLNDAFQKTLERYKNHRCLSDIDLIEYAYDDLDPDIKKLLKAHIENCKVCQDELLAIEKDKEYIAKELNSYEPEKPTLGVSKIWNTIKDKFEEITKYDLKLATASARQCPGRISEDLFIDYLDVVPPNEESPGVVKYMIRDRREIASPLWLTVSEKGSEEIIKSIKLSIAPEHEGQILFSDQDEVDFLKLKFKVFQEK